jgi:hypothetical protein
MSFSNPLSPKNAHILPSSFGNPHITSSSSNIILTINIKHIQAPFCTIAQTQEMLQMEIV